MIGLLRGDIARRSFPTIVVDVGGVGYELDVPLSTFEHLPEEGAPVHLEILTLMRAESLQLFGFATRPEKHVFETLIGVNGVGPRLALSVLGALTVSALATAVEREDASAFERVPGIGKKTARRLVLELRDRLELPQGAPRGAAAEPPTGEPEIFADAVTALENLGYRRAEAEQAVRAAAGSSSDGDLAALLRESLRRLGPS